MPKFACQYTDSRKKPEVTPKRGLIALVVDTQSNNKYGERSGKASLSSNNIPGVSVSEELTDWKIDTQPIEILA